MRLAVFGKHFQVDRLEQLTRMFSLLNAKGIEVSICDEFYDCLKTVMPEPPQVSDFILGDVFEADYVLSIGGDGTLLNTAHRVGRKQIPILGINTGRLGFLSASDGNDIDEVMDDLVNGRLQVEERSQLCVETDACRLDTSVALNEIAVSKRDNSAMLHIRACLNGEHLCDYQADGLVVSTATGSTAYSLSVGGPILMPESDGYIMVPIAPHSLTARPLVLNGRDEVELTVESRSRSFLGVVDGHSYVMPTNAVMRIRKADYVTRIVRRPGQSFVQTLRTKMMWGKDTRY